jgi:hypothetical protein
MQIDQLLKPIDPPPGGLPKLQQAIRSLSERRSSQSWRWQIALVCSVGMIWFGSQFSSLDNPGQTAELAVAALELELDGKTTAATLPQSHIVQLPSNNTQVKMYWLMVDG